MYYSYDINFIPEALATKYPNHAVYGTKAIFGESLESLTGIELTAEEINSYISTHADENYMSGLAEEGNEDQARIDARSALRVELQTLTPDSREIQVTDQQGKLLYDDWMSTQPTTDI
jgi:hypothetical protein